MTLGRPRRDVKERFWDFVPERPDEACWPWSGRRTESGYGEITIAGKHGQRTRAHRVSWEIANGPIPDGLCVLHRCDNRICVNPDHLFLGDRTDNSQDKVAKRRQARGSRIGCAKLTRRDVTAIRMAHATGERCASLARRFNVCHQNVSMIVRHLRWREE